MRVLSFHCGSKMITNTFTSLSYASQIDYMSVLSERDLGSWSLQLVSIIYAMVSRIHPDALMMEIS
jgi:hypothetical protein